MTAEDLSYASADRSTERMLHELQHTGRLVRPPRMAPPSSSRETFDRTLEEDETQAPTVSAKVSPVAQPSRAVNSNPSSVYIPHIPPRVQPEAISPVITTGVLAFLLGYVMATMNNNNNVSSQCFRSSEPSSVCRRTIERMLNFV